MILMIDNYDSFTFNLVQYLGEFEQDVKVVRNDEITLENIHQLAPSKIIISPGPCTPTEAGVSIAVIKQFANRIPILGVCLGHQCIATAFGGKVTHSKKIMHGKTSTIHHNNKGVFKGLKNPFTATRYHSLIVGEGSLPDCFEITAWTDDADGHKEEIMGIKHHAFPLEGVQFHPESILTEEGHGLLRNFTQQDDAVLKNHEPQI